MRILTRTARLAVLAILAAACSSTQTADDAMDHSDHMEPAAAGAAAGSAAVHSALQDGLPADANTAVRRLAASPRHGEWAMIPTDAGDSIRAWVVYPERSTPSPVVLVVHEIFGLTNWIRAVADQLAADGFIAIAPDLMTSHDLPTDDSGDPVRDVATSTIRTLDADLYHRQLTAIGGWGMALPAAASSYGIVGFCWGGSASFQHAIESSTVDAAVVYYGSSPQTAELARVGAPVLGLYAGDDARVNATVPPADSAMMRLGKPYSVHMFDGAGHGFLRQQDGRDGANMAATRRAWPMTVQFFRQHLR
ncbi:dienelactone hydrolase family protein [soil metagenome]